MNFPLVSIVTPSYNQASFLEQTIRSVLIQDYPNLEYIIVDGGSTDGSVEIIRKYTGKLAWWISEPDQGQADAINKGLNQTSGEILAWLNSDDLYAPNTIFQAVSALEAHPEAGLTYGNAMSIDEVGHPLNDLIFENWGVKELAAFNIICQPSVFIRRWALEQTGYLDPDFHYLLDHHLWLRIARIAPLKHISQCWAFPRHHPAAKNVAQASGFGEEAFRILRWMEEQPDLKPIIDQNRGQIVAAALRFKARYLLDGGRSKDALKAYLDSLFTHPSTALEEWHRMIFAALSLVGANRLRTVYYRFRRRSLPSCARTLGIRNVSQLYSGKVSTSPTRKERRASG